MFHALRRFQLQYLWFTLTIFGSCRFLVLSSAIAPEFDGPIWRGAKILYYPYKMFDLEIQPQVLVHQLLQAIPPLILDVRETWEFETAHLPNSLLMPMVDVPSRAHAELDPDEPIVVLCHHGARSLNVTIWLRAQGFEQVQSLASGIDGWSRLIDPAIPRY